MSISDEYFTNEVPEGAALCAVKWRSGNIEVCSVHVARVFAREPNALGARFCRLAPAAEVDRLKAENEKIHRRVSALRSDVAGFGDMVARLKAENEKLRQWVRDAYEEGYWDCHDRKQFDAAINTSEALKRLDGRAEP